MSFKSTLLLEEHLNSGRLLLENACKGLTESQIQIVKSIYNEFLPLIEASLTADQINQLFKNVEQQATTAGGNRTMLGKAADVSGQVNDIINKAGKWLQDTTPVKFADQKFEDLKAKVAAKFPNLDQQLTNFGTWMKENPGKSAAVIGVLTALASLAGGPVGGAIAGQVLRGAAELIKGEKLSTAVGKGIKTAALGYLSGKAFDILGKYVADMRAESIPFGPSDAGIEQVSYGATRTLTTPGLTNKVTLQGFNVAAFPEEADAINTAMNMIRNQEPGGFDMLQKVAREINSPEYKSAIDEVVATVRADKLNNDSLLQWIKGMAQAGQALSQGAVAASTGSTPAAQPQPQPTVEQVHKLFQKIHDHYVDEGILDTIKGAAGKAVDWAKTKGANLTNKVTADKLQQAWKAAGSPTDSDEIAKILQSAGVDNSIITDTFGKLNIQVNLNGGRIEPTLGNEPSAQPQSTQKVLVKDINKVIPTLKMKDLKALQTLVNDALNKRTSQTTP